MSSQSYCHLPMLMRVCVSMQLPFMPPVGMEAMLLRTGYEAHKLRQRPPPQAMPADLPKTWAAAERVRVEEVSASLRSILRITQEDCALQIVLKGCFFHGSRDGPACGFGRWQLLKKTSLISCVFHAAVTAACARMGSNKASWCEVAPYST